MSGDCFASFFFESSLRGYHCYYKDVHTVIGEVYSCCQEPDNYHDNYAVKVIKGSKLVGHVPIELSKIFCRLLDRGGVIEAEVIGSRYNLGQGKGLEVPIDYKFIANSMKGIRYLSTARKALTNLRPDTADTIMIETFH